MRPHPAARHAKLAILWFGLALLTSSSGLLRQPHPRDPAAVYLDTSPPGAAVVRLQPRTGQIRAGRVETGFAAVPVGRSPGPLNLDRHAPAELRLSLWGYADTVYHYDPSLPPERVEMQGPAIPGVVPLLHWFARHGLFEATVVFAAFGIFAVLRARRATRDEDRDALRLALGALETGVVIHGWRLGDEIGRGASARVFTCTRVDEESAEVWAVKMLVRTRSSEERTTGDTLFSREIDALRGLRHPNLPFLRDFGEAESVRYIVMERVVGETLRERLRRVGRLTTREGVELARQVCAALRAAHALGLVHRDLKPANIMITASGRVKLMDFGIARVVSEEDDRPPLAEGVTPIAPDDKDVQSSPSALNGADASYRGSESGISSGASQVSSPSGARSRRLAGTPGYIAPESLRGEVETWRADVYALGVVLFEALSGRPPFVATTTQALLHAHAHEAPPALEALSPEVGAALAALVNRLLSKEPLARCADEAEIEGELLRIATQIDALEHG